MTAQTEAEALHDDQLAELEDLLVEHDQGVRMVSAISDAVIRTMVQHAPYVRALCLSERWMFSDALYAFSNSRMFEDEVERLSRAINAATLIEES